MDGVDRKLVDVVHEHEFTYATATTQVATPSLYGKVGVRMDPHASAARMDGTWLGMEIQRTPNDPKLGVHALRTGQSTKGNAARSHY